MIIILIHCTLIINCLVISSIGDVLTCLKPRRPLRPDRKQRGPVKGLAPSDQNVDLLVYIARGFHVPMRQEKNNDAASSSYTCNWNEMKDFLKNLAKIFLLTDSRNDSDSDVVRPFVEVSFQRHTQRTYTSQGSNPTWNQQLILPFT